MRSIPLLVLLWWWAVTAPVLAQVRTYEDFHPSPEFVTALAKVDQGDTQGALDLWADIARRNPGTTLGAESLFRAAFYSPSRSQSQAIMSQIISGYPGSRFELRAKLNQLGLQFGYQDFQGRVQATDNLIMSFGAPGIQEIQTGNRSELVARYHSLPLDIQQGLVGAYMDLLACVDIQLEHFDEGLPLALFNREALPVVSPSRNPAIWGDLKYAFSKGKLLPVATVPYIDPKVYVKTPKPGHSVGPRPTIRADISVGDYRYPQVDLGALQLLVDGQDHRSEVVVESTINKEPLELNEPLEHLRLDWRPQSPLAHGTHTLTLVVQVQDYRGKAGRTATQLSFTVAADNDDADDKGGDDGQTSLGAWVATAQRCLEWLRTQVSALGTNLERA